MRGVIPSAAGAPGTPLGNGFEVAAGTVLIGDPVANRVLRGSGDGQTVTELWKATSLIQGGEPFTIIDDYLTQATSEGLVEQSRHGCDLDGQVTICSAYATTPAGIEPRVMAVTVLRGLRGDVLSDHVVVQHADGEADWLKSPDHASPGAAEVPAAPGPGDWPVLAAEGEALGTADELDRALVVMRGSRLAGPPRLTLEDATGGLEAVLEVTGDPEAVLQAYVDQFAEQGFDAFDLEAGTEIGGAVVTASGASVAGGDYYSFTLIERPGRPTWLHVSGGHD